MAAQEDTQMQRLVTGLLMLIALSVGTGEGIAQGKPGTRHEMTCQPAP